MSDIKYYYLDTETTGLSAGMHEITEIGVVRVEDKVQLFRKLKCLYPERASLDALAITKKTLADLELGEDREKVVNDVNNFLNQDGLTPAHRCIVAHNAQFDRKFVHAEWEKYGLAFPADLWLCTMAMTKEFVKNAGIDVENKKLGLPKQKVNLHASLDLLQVKKLSDAHNARVDSRNGYLLLKGLEGKVDRVPLIKSFVHTVSTSNGYTDEDFEDSLLP